MIGSANLLRCGAYTLDLGTPKLMGVINVTPDSFSDGGALFRGGRLDTGALRARAQQLLEDGADILDIGGESTRPGAAPVAEADECARVLPALEAIVELGLPVSIDTSSPRLMRDAITGGAALINDVRALRRPGAVELLAASAVGVCVMHMQGEPATMQQAPVYDDVVAEVAAFLARRSRELQDAGIAQDRILLDPGFGFGKTAEHNLSLLRRLAELTQLEAPLLVGLSRKGTIGLVTGQTDARLRVAGSVAAALLAVQAGARVMRVHDVRETRDALRVWQAVTNAA